MNRAKEANQFGILMVTHYTRILRYIKPDIVHVFADGHFIKTGGPELADELEETGYDAYLAGRLRFGKRIGMTDFAAIRSQFPIFDQEIHGHPLVYLIPPRHRRSRSA